MNLLLKAYCDTVENGTDKMNFPSVLIFGQPFNRHTGGGITLTNLFTGWDKTRLAVASQGYLMKNVTTDVCESYYLMGDLEFKWRFPFNFLQRPFTSGVLDFNKTQLVSASSNRGTIRKAFVDKFFYPALQWLGLFHCGRTSKLSDKFKAWLSEFKPEILYLQVASRDTVLFASQLVDYLSIPSIIHFMDDWPSTISTKGPFRHLWSRIIDTELKELINKVDMHFSISNAMSDEYSRRYGKEFIAFHNPVDMNMWKRFIKSDFGLSKDHYKVLYSGRIGPGIGESVVEVAEAINDINLSGTKIILYIQSANVDPDIKRILLKYSCVWFNPVAEYSELPLILSSADILLLANDFDEKGEAFLKYSMPTKASEYMISGTPMLVYSPGSTAITKFCLQYDCAKCVNIHSKDAISSAMIELFNDEEYRRRISKNAVQLANELFNADTVRKKLTGLVLQLARRRNQATNLVAGN